MIREMHMKYQGKMYRQWIRCLLILSFLSFFSFSFHPYCSLAARRKQYNVNTLDHDFPYTNCSMSIIDADVRDVLRAFANKYELNIIMSEDVKGTISIIINDIPVKEAFKNILQYSDLGYIKEKNVYSIKSLRSMLEEEKLKKKTEEMKIEIIKLKNDDEKRLAKNL